MNEDRSVLNEVERSLRTLRNEAASTRERLLALRVLSQFDDSPQVLANILRAAGSQNKRLAEESAEVIKNLDSESLFKLMDYMLLNREEISYFGQKMFETLHKLREQDVTRYIVVNALKDGEDWEEKRRTLSQWMRNLGLIDRYVDMMGEIPTDLAKLLGRILKRVDDRVVLDIARSVKGINKEKSVKLLDVLYDVADNVGIAPILVNLLTSEDKRIRSKTALILGKLSDNLHFFRNALKDPDPRVRANAIEGLWELKNPKAKEIYLEALGDENNRVRANAAKGLYEMGDPRGLGTLKEMLEDKDAMMRASAAWVLGEVGDTNLIDKLERIAAEDPAEIAQRNGIKALEKISIKRIIPNLRDLIHLMNGMEPDQLPDPPRFFGALASLRSVRNEMRMEILSVLPPTDSPIIRRKLIESITDNLEEMEDDGTVLLSLVAAPGFDEKPFWTRIFENVEAIRGDVKSAPAIFCRSAEIVPDMLIAALEGSSPSVAAAIAKILRWEGESVFEKLMTMLDEQNPSIRALGALTIGELGRPEACDRLEEISRSDPEISVRESAEKAVDKLKAVLERASDLPDELHMRILHLSLTNLPEIAMSVSLTDGESNPFTSLRDEDLILFENGRPLDYKLEQVNENMPISVAVLMDYSLSMSDEDIANMQEAVTEFVSLMRSEDRIAILKFAEEIVVSQPLDRADRLQHTSIKEGYKGDRDGTRLYDALGKAISILSDLKGIKLAVVLTDGEDSGSDKMAQDVVDEALRNGISIHTVALGDEVDEETLKRLAMSTGGSYYTTGDPGKLKEIYREISSSMQRHYRLTYRSQAYENDMRRAFLVVRADLGALMPETWTKVILRNG
jgi:VWFA-related protein